jgi:hypothetical protein
MFQGNGLRQRGAKRLLRVTLEAVASVLGIRPNVTHLYFSFKVKKMEEFPPSHFFGRGNN